MNEDKLQYLLDRQSIRDTLLRHGMCFDECNLDGLDEVWAADCRRDDGPERGGMVMGRDALKKKLAKAMHQFNWTHHQLGESFIEIEGDTATSMTFVACWHEMRNGDRCWGTARYYDELRRDGERWLLTLRRLVMTGAEGAISGHGGVWVNRQLPPLDAK